MFKCRSRFRAFTLVEALSVLAVISVLSALLLPVLGTVRGKARQLTCVSNLRFIGQGVSLYIQDSDGYYPYAVDPVDKTQPSIFSRYPAFAADIPHLGLLHEVLQPYIKSKVVFLCPSDTGFDFPDFSSVSLNAYPSSYAEFGTSYYYRTSIAARHIHEANMMFPFETNVLFDENGSWHGTLTPITSRYNVLFGDGHVKNINRAQIDEAWSTPLSAEG